MADDTGYIYKFWIYKGVKKNNEISTPSAKPHDIVMDMLNVVPSGNYIILADSYYGSGNLAVDLAKAGFRFIIACRGDRPKEWFNNYLAPRLAKGEWRCMTHEELGILAMTFSDTKKVRRKTKLKQVCSHFKKVHFITNCDNDAVSQTRTGKRKPSLVVHYNFKMHGVDKADAFSNMYLYKHRKVNKQKLLIMFN
jgi:hypothetical protein